MNIWRKHILGRESSKCKGPKMGGWRGAGAETNARGMGKGDEACKMLLGISSVS